ncbi:MAG: META domain-containing protein [Planctomycetota bacterium]
MPRPKTIGILACATLVPIAASPGCSEPTAPPPPAIDAAPFAAAVRQAELDWTWIAGTEWVLGAIEGADPIGQPARLSFKSDQTWMSGSGGCNTFTGGFVRRGVDGIGIGPIRVTRMFCDEPEGVMQQEARLLHLLAQVSSYRATEDTLVLYDDTRPVLIYVADRAAAPSP